MIQFRCKKCVLSNSFPSIDFDSDGICSFCRGEAIATTHVSAVEAARVKLSKLLEEKKFCGDYDAIVSYSGGKDSSYTLKLAVEKYNLKVLSYTLDNGFISPVAFQNIKRVVESLGVDHITIKPSSKIFNATIKAAAFNDVFAPGTLRRISSGCNVCISIVNNTALRIALEKRIPFILTGFTLGQIPANTIIYKNNYQFLIESRRRLLEMLKKIVGMEAVSYFSLPDYLISGDLIYPDTINLLCLENITEDEVLRELAVFGWEMPNDVDGCSSNCRLNAFNNYVHQNRFGYSPYELELSHLIRSGLLTRQQALEKLRDQPIEQINYAIRKLKISDSELNKIKRLSTEAKL